MPRPNLYIFDDSAVEQGRLLLQAELFRAYIRAHAAEFVPTPPTRILDLGCGVGHLTQALHELYPQAEVIGMDHNAESLATARKQPGLDGKVRFVEGDILEALPPGPFDLVYTSLVLSHLRDLGRVVDLVYAALAPAGTFWVKDIDAYSVEAASDPDFGELVTLYFRALRQAGNHPDVDTALPPLLKAARYQAIRVVQDEAYPMGGDTIEGDCFLSGLIAGVHTGHKMLSRITGMPEEEILRRLDHVTATAQASKEPLGYLHAVNIIARRPALAQGAP